MSYNYLYNPDGGDIVSDSDPIDKVITGCIEFSGESALNLQVFAVNDTSFKLGVPAPIGKPVVSNLPTEQDDEGFANDQTIFYTYTYVTEVGEEGQPSPLSDEVTIYDPVNDTVDITFPNIIPEGYNITHIRLYRSATTAIDANYFHVADIPIAAKDTPYTDSASDEELGGTLVSSTYDMPPTDMKGIVSIPNGILAGFSGNSVCFSEAFQPHAWPFGYRQTTEHDIVGLAVFGNSLFVATEGKPYVFTGTSPDSMTGQKLEINQACVSKASIVDMGEYVIYASSEGLVSVSSNSVQILTKDIARKDQWKKYQPETIRAYQVEGKYIAFYGGTAGFIFEPSDGSFVEVDFYADAGFNVLKDDMLYLVANDSVHVWDAGTSGQTFIWKKRFELNNRVSPSVVRMETEGPGDITFRLYSENGLVCEITNPMNEAFRLPRVRSQYFEIELTGTKVVRRLVLASAFSEV